MEIEPEFRAGYVALVGRPNVGKSTLMNALLGQKVAAVSPRPQTTRHRQLGILTTEQAQIVFMDTPGIHKPVHKLGEYMNQVAEDTLNDADLIIWLVEANNNPTPEDLRIAEKLAQINALPPVLLAVNKLDLTGGYDIAERLIKIQALYPAGKIATFSASTGAGLNELLATILTYLPVGAPFFDPDQITDFYERDIASELIREAALLNLREEIPHGVAVRIDDYEEREDGSAYIHATLFVEREAHKGIVIGKGGEMLKKIGTGARQAIEEMSDRKAYLDLRVKVNQNWRNKPDALRWLGYVREKGQ